MAIELNLFELLGYYTQQLLALYYLNDPLYMLIYGENLRELSII